MWVRVRYKTQDGIKKTNDFLEDYLLKMLNLFPAFTAALTTTTFATNFLNFIPAVITLNHWITSDNLRV